MKIYEFVNKSVVPRPFKGRVLRFNRPVRIECNLNEKDIIYLKGASIVYREVQSAPEMVKAAKASKAAKAILSNMSRKKAKDEKPAKGANVPAKAEKAETGKKIKPEKAKEEPKKDNK